MEFVLLSIVLLMGILLILLEIFLIPGITVFGLLGGLIYIVGIVYAFISYSTGVASLFLGASVILFGGLFLALIKGNLINKVALKKEIDEGLQSVNELPLVVGQEGVALSRLNPIGKALFGECEVEVKSEMGWIDEEVKIQIVRIENNQVIVSVI